MGIARLVGRRLLVSGSIAPTTNAELAVATHETVRAVSLGVLERGGGLVVYLGKEPRTSESHALTFDWTILEAAYPCLKDGACNWADDTVAPIVAVGSEKAFREIPEARRELWESLVQLKNAVRVEQIMPGARSGALIRERQAEYADVLLTLGGATGVEHLAELFLSRRLPVIPLDLPLGASRGDGTGGSERMASRARSYPAEFFALQPGNDPGAHLALLTANGRVPDPHRLASNVLRTMDVLALPDAFCVRLMNPDHPDYERVKSFFHNVVHPVLADLGMNVVDLTVTATTEAFLNQEIFRSLHFSHFVVIDITGSRPNCFIELGYALGRQLPFCLTCDQGTAVPFDPDALPRFHWNSDEPDDARRAALFEHIRRNRFRRPIVG